MRSRGYAPFSCSAYQDQLLQRAEDLVSPGVAAVFDLDGCLFDTRNRQLMIFREFAARFGFFELYSVEEQHITDWNLKTPLRAVGASEERIDAFYEAFHTFWWERFFSDLYVRMDYAMPGAVELVRACHHKGAVVVYLTGRDHTMRAGTEASLKAFGFPYAERAHLFTKPEFSMDDTEYKERALKEIELLGEPKLFIDNEPSNVNRFQESCPDALVLFIETDHSPRPITPASNIPWLRSFCRTSWHGDKWPLYEEEPLYKHVEQA
jgi:beta-phosphoglucomutase-like phosphatase (HAD superfamily)